MAESQALKDLRKGLVAVDDVLGFVKQTAGKPSKPEKSLFVASVGLSYAMWENYVEEVAIEVTTFLSEQLPPALVPDEVRDAITKAHPSSWDIAVHPGWRALWRADVEKLAKGESNAGEFGINTANERNVKRLFERVGVEPFANASAEDLEKLEKLIQERGEIVHTGKAPPSFYKENATGWREFVAELAQGVDAACADGARELAGKAPW
jgi:hypothetical protein